MTSNSVMYIIRDFGYPTTSRLHYGEYPEIKLPEYKAKYARCLYDFEATEECELSFKKNDLLYIKNKLYPGWLLGELNNQEGMVPESYLSFEEFIQD